MSITPLLVMASFYEHSVHIKSTETGRTERTTFVSSALISHSFPASEFNRLGRGGLGLHTLKFYET